MKAVSASLMMLAVLPLLSVPFAAGQFGRQGQSARPVVLRFQPAQPQTPSQGTAAQYNAASFAVTELARTIGAIMGQQSNAGVFSPVSIACALSLMLLGAEQQTKQELMRVLKFEQYENNLNAIHQLYSGMLNELASTAPDAYPPPWRRTNPCYGDDQEDEDFPFENDVLRLTNAVFVRDGLTLDPGFRQSSYGYYNSTAVNLPFGTQPAQSAAFINDWVSRSTEGKIREIVPSTLGSDTEMVVASALYFKGLWTEMFEPQATNLKPFYPDGYGRPGKQVLAMSAIGCFPYYDAVEYDAKIVGLSYQGNKSAMYFIMPNNSTRERMQRFQQGLRAEHIIDMVGKMVTRKLYIQIPKMKISNTINLRDVLQRLGLRTIFYPGQSDLSGMLSRGARYTRQAQNFGGSDASRVWFPDDNIPLAPATASRPAPVFTTVPTPVDRRGGGGNVGGKSQALHVSEFIHKVELDINEKGTEGGAVTASTVFRSLPSASFRADAPFLMLLGHDQTRLPVFYGTIYDPSSR